MSRYSYSVMPEDMYEYQYDNVTGEYRKLDFEERKFRPWCLYLTDAEERVKLLCTVTPKTEKEYFESTRVLSKAAKEYLEEHYPDYEDVFAYWD